MRRLACLVLTFMCLALMNSCKDDEEVYPSIVTNLVDCLTDKDGSMLVLQQDDGTKYTLTNPPTGLHPNALYRCLCGYTITSGKATLYTLSGAYYLHDSTSIAVKDPVTIVSAWQTSRYINIHLRPKTQGGTQYWGYVTDSIVGQHAYLSLHHRQNEDSEAYSTDVYASIPLDSIPAQTITLQNSYEYRK